MSKLILFVTLLHLLLSSFGVSAAVAIAGFTLYNANTDLPIVDLPANNTELVDLTIYGRQLSVVVQVTGLTARISYVEMTLDGTVKANESEPLYCLGGKLGSDIKPVPALTKIAYHTLTATVYGPAAVVLASRTVTFTTVEIGALIGLIVVDAQTGRDVQVLRQNEMNEIELPTIEGVALTIRAETTGDESTVAFNFSGATDLVMDATPPYTLTDTLDAKFPPMAKEGNYALTATALDASGRAIGTYVAKFSVAFPLTSQYRFIDASMNGTQDNFIIQGSAPIYQNGSRHIQGIGRYKEKFYQGHRYGPQFSIAIKGLTPLLNYRVTIGFAENYFRACGVNKRVMDIAANGQTIASALDIYGEVGCYSGLLKDGMVAANHAGKIIINFNAVIENAMYSFIEIESSTVSTAPSKVSPAPVPKPSGESSMFCAITCLSGRRS
jgi:Malectin domain